MSITKSVYEGLMKIVVRIADVIELAKRFEASPTLSKPEYVVASVCPATPPLSDGVRRSRDAAPVRKGSLDDLADVPAAPFEGEKGPRVEGQSTHCERTASISSFVNLCPAILRYLRIARS